MKKIKQKKRESRIIYDIIPPHLVRDIILVEKKVSRMVRASYLFLKTSKYGSAVLVLGVAVFGGAIIFGFSPKVEVTEIYPTQYEGDWQNMEKGLIRELSDKANVSGFNHNNSTGVVEPEEETYGEFLNDDDTLPEEIEEMNQAEEVEEEVQVGDIEPMEEIDKTKKEEVGDTKPAVEESQEGSTRSMEPTEEPAVPNETEEFVPAPEPQEDLEPQEEQSLIPSYPENPDEEVSFFKKTINLFSVFEANAEEVQVGDAEPTVDETENNLEEKFEDFTGIIITVPDVDGNFLSEIEDEIIEETQTIFTEELSVVYSDFPVPLEKGELKKIKVGFSFANLEKENEDDEIIILWSLNGEDWNNVSEFVLNKNYSNKDNNGYFYADIFDLADSNNNEILQWEDLENIKVKFSYLTNNNKEDYVPFFLDAVWLETESEELDEEFNDEEKDEEEKIEILSFQKDFKMGEEPKFKFKYKKEKEGFFVSIGETLGVVDYWDDINLTAEIITPDGETFEVPSEEFGDFSEIFTLEKEGEISIKLKEDIKFKPGLYKIILKIEEDGNVQILEQDFTWGVLAINVNKSIYLPGEEAYLQMGVLRDDGHTICDAELELRIKNQVSSEEMILSTKDGTIQYSGQCSGNNVTDVPDYFAYYTTGEAGIYEMKLTNLDNGYEIIDSFEVRESVPFDVERIGPTRIYPPADYEMVLKIKANENFVGEIIEKVPEGFIINDQFPISNFQSISNDSMFKQLIWDIDIKQGDELEIRYTFNAPDISPYIYLLGPLKFEKGNIIFEEIRQWQIASDAFSVVARGSAVEFNSDTSLAVSPSVDIAVGKIAIISCNSGNTSTFDGPSTDHSVTDTDGHTWEKVFEETCTDGSVSDGSTTSLWWTKVTNEIGTGDSITLTLGTARVNKIIAIVEATIADGYTVVAIPPPDITHSEEGEVTKLSDSQSGLTSREYLFFGLFGAEGRDATKTAIANYTEHYDLVTYPTGSANSKTQMHVGTRILTGTGDTWTTSTVSFTNGIQSLTAFYEEPETTSISISGNAYEDEAETDVWGNGTTGCDSSTARISLVIDGGTVQTTSCDSSTGYYEFTDVTVIADNPVSVFFNTAGDNTDDEGAAVTVAADVVTDITLNPIKNIVSVKTEGAATNITNANLSHCDSSVSDPVCTSVPYDVDGSSLTTEDGIKLIVTENTFAPTGTVTTSISTSGTDTVIDGDLLVQSGATLSMASNALSVGGDYVNSGTFSKTSPQTTTFTATTTTGFEITPGTGSFDNLTFNGSSGGWTLTATTDVDGNFTITNGAVIAPSTTLTIGGSYSNSGTFTHNSGTVTLDGIIAQAISGSATTAFNNLTVTNASAAVSSSVNFDVVGTLNMNHADSILTPAVAVVINSSGVAGTITGSGTVQVTRTAPTPDYSSQYKFSTDTLTNLTVEYTAAAAQTVSTVSYGNLKISTTASAVATLAAATTVTGILTISSEGTFDISSNTLTIAGSGTPFVITSGGTFTTTNSTVRYTSSSDTYITQTNYHNLQLGPGSW